jgi:hypothetical protein
MHFIWLKYIGEKARTFAKPYGIKLRHQEKIWRTKHKNKNKTPHK